MTKLVGQLAKQRDETPPGENEVEAWYIQRFHSRLRYETLVEGLAPTQLERQQLLRQFFESDPLNPSDVVRKPSTAHYAAARLVHSGHVRIILTLNFDRLVETALHEEGITPVIVSDTSQLQGLAPLHTIPALVVHLHGDYLSPTTMLNTIPELNQYGSALDTFLDEVFRDYGLIAVGWSAAYDPALRAAIDRTSRKVFTSYFINSGQVGVEALQLIAGRTMRLVTDTADAALGRLSENVATLTERDARHPLSLLTAIGLAKRGLAGEPTAIALHDSLRDEIERVRNQPDLNLNTLHRLPSEAEIRTTYARLVENSVVASGLIGALAYWGEMSTDQWWLEEIERFTYTIPGGGTTALLKMPMIPAIMFFHAAGVASVAAGRFELTRKLLFELTSVTERGAFQPVNGRLDPSCLFATQAPSMEVFRALKPTFIEHIALGERPYEEAWEIFEFLSLVANSLQQDGVAELLREIQLRRNDLNRLKNEQSAENYPEPVPKSDVDAAHRQLVANAHEELSQAIASHCRSIPISTAHLRVQDLQDGNGWGCVVARRLLAGPSIPSWRKVFLGRPELNVTVYGNVDWVAQTIGAVSSRLGELADAKSFKRDSDVGGHSVNLLLA